MQGIQEGEGEGLPTCFGSIGRLRRYLEWYNRCLCTIESKMVLTNDSSSLALARGREQSRRDYAAGLVRRRHGGRRKEFARDCVPEMVEVS